MTAPPDQCELSSYAELVEVITNLRFLVREKRRRERLSMRAVCRETGLSPSTLTRLETHGHDLSTDGLVALVKWLGGLHDPRTCVCATAEACREQEEKSRV